MNITKTQKNIFYLVILIAVSILLSCKGISDENVIALNGDMPRYLMNGVFFYDAIQGGHIFQPFEFAVEFFSRYPALSIGHHPILPGLAEVPFYALFGVSVFSARLCTVFFFLGAVILWYFLVKSFYDEEIAFFSSLLFATTPFIISLSFLVMSEMSALFFLILSVYLFHLYCESDKKKFLYWWSVILPMTLYAKQTVVFILPVMLAYLLLRKGVNVLRRKEIYIAAVFVTICLIPLAVMTWKLSPLNVQWVVQQSSSSKLAMDNLLFLFIMLKEHHLTLPVLGLSIVSTIISFYKKDKRTFLFFLWILACYLFITSLGVKHHARYSMFWIPPFCLLAVSFVWHCRTRMARKLVCLVITFIAFYQFVYAYQMEPEYVEGYEDAAKYVVENGEGPIVLYSSSQDTGYFVFFMRKHGDGNPVVLRANKILATSKMRIITEDLVSNSNELYEILKGYGVQYIVLEDIDPKSNALRILRNEVGTPNFLLKKRFILKSNNPKINGIPLLIYEYLKSVEPNPEIMLNMDIPLVNRSISIQYKSLLKSSF